MKIVIAIGSHFRIHWKLVVCFVVIWTVIITGAFLIPLAAKEFSIADSILWKYIETKKESGINRNGTMQPTTPITYLYNMLFKGWGMVIYGAVIIVFINKILLKEFSSTQIALWLTQPLSKNQSLISKYLFLFLVLTLFYLPAFIVLLSVSSAAIDAKTLWINVFLGGLQTYIFLIMFSLILFVIALLLINHTTIFNVTASLIVGYFVVIGALAFMVLVSSMEDNFVDAVIKYVGPQVFITEMFPHDLIAEPIKYIISETIEGNVKTTFYIEAIVVKEFNKVSYGLLTPLMICVSAMLTWTSTWLFQKQSFNV